MRVVAENGTKVWLVAEVPFTDGEALLGEHHDGPAFRGLVRQRRQLGGVGELLLAVAAGGEERRGHAVARA